MTDESSTPCLSVGDRCAAGAGTGFHDTLRLRQEAHRRPAVGLRSGGDYADDGSGLTTGTVSVV